ncbi:MAG: hypothetical protein JSW34_01455 [Candidatus Zixiibacteriota bacterium]|nr:MAG: hypothetical protein JSW34_01455 [candidate division Zixibacteria bacterium]
MAQRLYRIVTIITAIVVLVLFGCDCSTDNPSGPQAPVVTGTAKSVSGLDAGSGGGGPRKNLVHNPGFESGFALWHPVFYAHGWSVSGYNPHGGDSCMTFTFPDDAGFYSAAIETDPYFMFIEQDVAYRFSFWLRERYTHKPGHPDLSIVGCCVKVNGNCYSNHPLIFPSQDWQFVNETMIFPESGQAAVHFRVYGYATSAGAEFALDDIVLMKK